MKRGLLVLLSAVLILSTVFCTAAISAEDFPTQPIKIIVWSTAGMADTLTRILAANMEKDLGQPVVVENKPGAAGTIAINEILHSKPDGYTIGMAVTSNYIVTPHIRKVSYNMLTDETDIVAICKYSFGLAVKADAPWNTYEDVLAYAKANPGKFTYATAGVGTTQHIAMERIAMKEGIKWTQVPFKSGGESVLACLGGSTDATVQGSLDLLPHLKAGKLKLLLSLDGSRWPDYPNVPEIREKGYDFTAMSYISYLGPAGIPEPIRQKLEDAFKRAMEKDNFKETIAKFKVESKFISGQDYSKMWRSQYDAMGKILDALGLVKK